MRVASYLLGILLAIGATGVSAASESGFVTYGHPALEAIDEAYLTGEITEAEALLYRFYFCKNWDKLPAQFQIEGEPLRCGTPILAEVYERMDGLPAAMLAEITLERYRPGGLLQTRTTAHYIIHYTLTGGDAVPNESYVDVIESACEATWQRYHVQMTWQTPPGDGAIGGGMNLIDCYIHDLGAGTLGMAEYESPVPGDPPYDYTGFFHVDNSIVSVTTRACTVAHEDMHVVQFGYYATGAGSCSWYWENCAMMGEEWVYDNYNDYRGYVSAFIGKPWKSLKYMDGQYEYGGIVWPMYKVERFENNNLIEAIYDELQWLGGINIWDAFNIELAPYGYDFQDAYREFIRWCFYTRDRDDGNHFEEGGSWSAFMFPDLTLNSYPTGEQHPRTSPQDRRPEPLGTSVMCFFPETGSTDEVLQVDLDAPNTYTLSCDFIRKQDGVDLWYEYYMAVDPPTGDGTIEIPQFHESEYVFMLTSIGWAPGGPRDYAFWGYTLPGGAGVDDLNIGELVRIWPFHPNPLVDHATVSYALAAGGNVDVQILDTSGRLVKSLYSGDLHAGNYEVMWNGQDDAGHRVAAGVYFARVSVNGLEQVRPVTVLR